MAKVVVQVAHDVAAGLTAGDDRHGPFAAAESFGLKLERTHPDSSDPALSRWFHAEVDNGTATEFVKAMRESPGVTAAYVKPPTEAP